MSYRDPPESPGALSAALASGLDHARRAAEEARSLSRRAQAVEKQLLETQRRLESQARRALPLLDDVRVASPCTASWDEMTGDDRVRFCGQCSKNVYNLSAMTREAAERLLMEREGSLCVRFYRRADGTVLTDDCPVGRRRRHRTRQIAAAIGASALAVAAAAGAGWSKTLRGNAVTGAVAPAAVQGGVPQVSMGETPQVPTATSEPRGPDETPPSPRAPVRPSSEAPRPALHPVMGALPPRLGRGPTKAM